MKTTFASAVLALCLLATVAYANGPFSLTCQPFGTDEWEYTLYNTDPAGADPWFLDLNWIDYWEEDQEPQREFVITGSPEDHGWDAYAGIVFPAWDAEEPDPAPGANITGFRIQASEPALIFRVTYDDQIHIPLPKQIGSVTFVPEPTSVAQLACLCLAAGLGLRRRSRR